MKYDKNRVINIIVNAAENYRKYLQDKVFLIVYQEKGTTKITQVEFRDNHFLHLTGVKSKVTAGRFY